MSSGTPLTAPLVGGTPIPATPPRNPEIDTDQPLESGAESSDDADYNIDDGDESDFD